MKEFGGSMIKSELVECVTRNYPGLYQRDAETAVDAVLDAIADALATGNRVEIRGFGAFSAKGRRSRVGRNPRTGQRVPVVAKRVPTFKASKEIREALNPIRVKASRTRNRSSPERSIEAESAVGD
ncbi:integration host factor subunit beta [Rhizobiales bacterium GAS113]|nr:integration host factor subunit beta [Rhizobiales bacterium GAS113]